MCKIVDDLSCVFDAEMGRVLSDSGIVGSDVSKVCVIMVAMGTV